MQAAQPDSRYAYRLVCGDIGLGSKDLSEHDHLFCAVHRNYERIAGFGIRWSRLQAEAASESASVV